MKKALLLIASTLVIFTGCITSDDSSTASSTTQTNPELEEANAQLDSIQTELEISKDELIEAQQDYIEEMEDDEGCESRSCKNAKNTLETKETKIDGITSAIEDAEKNVKDTEERIEKEQQVAIEAAQSSAQTQPSSNRIDIKKEFEVIEITDTYITYLEDDNYCRMDEMVENTTEKTMYYNLSGSKVEFEDREDCNRMVYSGSHSSILGKWNFVSQEYDENLSNYCYGDESEFPENVTMTGFTEVTDTKLTLSYTMQFGCLVDDFGMMTIYDDEDMDDSEMFDYQVTKVDCNTVEIDMMGITMRMTLTIENEEMHVTNTFYVGNKECSYSDVQPLGDESQVDCSDEGFDDDYDGDMDDEFMTCYTGLITELCVQDSSSDMCMGMGGMKRSMLAPKMSFKK